MWASEELPERQLVCALHPFLIPSWNSSLASVLEHKDSGTASGWPSEAERELIPEDLEWDAYQPNSICTWTCAELGSNFYFVYANAYLRIFCYVQPNLILFF